MTFSLVTSVFSFVWSSSDFICCIAVVSGNQEHWEWFDALRSGLAETRSVRGAGWVIAVEMFLESESGLICGVLDTPWDAVRDVSASVGLRRSQE